MVDVKDKKLKLNRLALLKELKKDPFFKRNLTLIALDLEAKHQRFTTDKALVSIKSLLVYLMPLKW